MIPRYPFEVRMCYHNGVHPPVVKAFETMASALAMVIENRGKANIQKITLYLILEEVNGPPQIRN